MEKHNNIQKDPFADSCASIISGVISVFLLVLVVGLPLYLHNSYFDILEAKYKWYYGSFLAMLAIVLVLSLVMLGIDFKEFGGDQRIIFGLETSKLEKNISSGGCSCSSLLAGSAYFYISVRIFL